MQDRFPRLTENELRAVAGHKSAAAGMPADRTTGR
jgi:hypothetical protein